MTTMTTMTYNDERPYCDDCNGYKCGGLAAYECECCCSDSDDETDTDDERPYPPQWQEPDYPPKPKVIKPKVIKLKVIKLKPKKKQVRFSNK